MEAMGSITIHGPRSLRTALLQRRTRRHGAAGRSARATERGARVYMPDLSDALAENAGNFDLIVAFDVMEHMTPEQLLVLFDTLAALLKSGGHVLA